MHGGPFHTCQSHFLFIPNNACRKEEAYLKTAKQIAGWLYNLSKIPDGKLPKYWWRSLHCKWRKNDDPERSAAAMFVSFRRLGPGTEGPTLVYISEPRGYDGAWSVLSIVDKDHYLCRTKIFFYAFCFAPCTVSAFLNCTSAIDC